MAFVYAPSPPSAPSTTPRIFRVVIASEYALVRDALDAVIKARANMELVAHAANARAAIAKSRHFSPDVLVLDATIALAYGPNVAPQIKTLCPQTHVLVLSDLAEHTYPAELFRLGVAGCVSEKSTPDTLLRAIEMVGRGKSYLDPSLTKNGVDVLPVKQAKQAKKGADSVSPVPVGCVLSEQEQGVLRRVAQGYAQKEVATQLGLSVKTIETYKQRAMGKLDIHTRVDLVSYAMRNGWFK